MRLTGDDCAIGVRGVRVQGGIDLGIRAVRGGAAINVVARYTRTGIPREVDAVLSPKLNAHVHLAEWTRLLHRDQESRTSTLDLQYIFDYTTVQKNEAFRRHAGVQRTGHATTSG
jgi:hypothetical protein